MPIRWSRVQLQQVSALIDAHPVRSGECADLARRILPVARERDAAAAGMVIRPLPDHGIYVVPRVGGTRWRHHVTVAAENHCVDALTGAPGTPRGDYLEQHWSYAEELSMELDDLEDPCL